MMQGSPESPPANKVDGHPVKQQHIMIATAAAFTRLLKELLREVFGSGVDGFPFSLGTHACMHEYMTSHICKRVIQKANMQAC